MPISGVVIRCRLEKALEVSETMALGGEVHGHNSSGRLP